MPGGKLPKSLVKTIKRNSLIYKRSFTPVSKSSLEKKNTHQWFALSAEYFEDDTYGPIITTWKTKVPLNFLNISTMKKRHRIAQELDRPLRQLDWLDCDEQYAGGQENAKTQRMLMPVIRQYKLDGTYIHDDEADEECCGASEIVLVPQSIKKITKL